MRSIMRLRVKLPNKDGTHPSPRTVNADSANRIMYLADLSSFWVLLPPEVQT